MKTMWKKVPNIFVSHSFTLPLCLSLSLSLCLSLSTSLSTSLSLSLFPSLTASHKPTCLHFLTFSRFLSHFTYFSLALSLFASPHTLDFHLCHFLILGNSNSHNPNHPQQHSLDLTLQLFLLLANSLSS